MAKRNTRHLNANRTQWIEAAERLRTIRLACVIFLDRWAAGKVAAEVAGVERIAADLDDPYNRDWSLLYKGSVLDD